MTEPTEGGQTTNPLRSMQWYGGDDRNGYIHRAWMRRGLPRNAFDGRPQIAIANTASDLTPCNSHLDEVAQSVKEGVYEAGGIPLNLPVVSLGETLVRPTAMLWRNMAAMAMEEMFRANPIDGLVLLGGCDKTIPALLMAAASVDIPAVVVPGGPMLNGTFRGQLLGCGTGVWQLSEEVRAGTLPEDLFLQSESSMIRSRGHCNTMGTASTMAVMAEALGMTIPGLAGTPAADSRLLEASHQTGRLAVEMVREGRTISSIITPGSFRNAIVALAAVGGSTNAVVHLLAIAGRLGLTLTVDDFDAIGAKVPLLVNLQPAGHYLMEDLFRAGGLLAVLNQVRDLLDPEPITVTGRPLTDYLDGNPIWDEDVISPRSKPLLDDAGIAVLRGNLVSARCAGQAGRRIGGTVGAPRSGRRVQLDRRPARAHRRSRPGRRRRFRARAARVRTQGLPRHARGGQPSPAAQAARARCARHGPHLRRADERDGLRHRRTACGAGSCGGGSVGTGAGRRHDRARRAGPHPASRRT